MRDPQTAKMYFDPLERRASVAAEELTRQGIPVRFLGAISVSAEMCFYLFEALSAAVVGGAIRRAAIPFESIVEAIRFEPGVSDGRASWPRC